MTNGERIRSMTDEELADILPSGDCFCCRIMPISTHPAYDSCEECALAWLKSDSEDEKMSKSSILTPIDFEKHIKTIVDTYKDDEELRHICMDGIIINLLRSLGYGAGCDIFDYTPKWYA